MANRLRWAREQKKLSQKFVSIELSVSAPTVSEWESGRKTPSIDNYIKLSELYGYGIDYLLGREATKNKKDPALSSEALRLAHDYDSFGDYGRRALRAVADIEIERTSAETPVVDLGTIRHYRGRPAAGVGGLVEGEDYDDIPRTAETPKNADYCLTVSGDSMEPYIKDGQTIYVERDAEIQPLDVGVFAVNGDVYVKQYAPGYLGELYLLSANPARQDANKIIPPDSTDTVRYYGKVILPTRLPRPEYK